MNICGGSKYLESHRTIEKKSIGNKIFDGSNHGNIITLTLDDTKLRFYEDPGEFKVIEKIDETGDEGFKNKELNELKVKIASKKEKISFYEKKIKDLDYKLKNLKRVLLMNDREQQYINVLGQYKNENNL